MLLVIAVALLLIIVAFLLIAVAYGLLVDDNDLDGGVEPVTQLADG